MWHRMSPIIAIGLTLSALAETRAAQTDFGRLLISDPDYVRFDVSMGRLRATTIRAKQDRQRIERDLPGGHKELLATSLDRGLISLQYALDCGTRQLTVQVVRRDDLEIRWTQRDADGETCTSIYVQRPGDDVMLSICTTANPVQQYRAPSLWHLAIIHRDVCESHLAEVLQLVCPDWDFVGQTDKIRDTLLQPSPAKPTTSLAEVRLLVRQLAERDFRVRQRADRELQSRGQQLLCLLNELDQDELDAEQRLRLCEIRRSIMGDAADTPLRVSQWMANDKRIWIPLMGDDNSTCRMLARAQLARIFERAVPFDPHAEPRVRAEQLASLRNEYLRR